ncbi:MAG: hypothetical protein EP343_06705 [Deltaproteobacteria bacterium]|nr:MAG: hypothetical protein EP343_06705 [Deltaproteobacteria bacterium]
MFWKYHDMLFANQRQLKRNHLEKYARKIGLDMDQFKAALDTKRHKAAVDADIQEGGGVGVGGTPTVFINGEKAKGFDFNKLKAQVDPMLIAKGYKLEDLPSELRHQIPVGNSTIKGPSNAPITIAEFSDFECPFCSSAGREVSKLAKMYPKHVRVVFKHFPLSFHKKAPLASQASLAANEQGKFWEYHDLLFANQQKLDRKYLIQYAEKLKLNVARFKQVLDSGIFKEQVDNDMALGRKVGVQGTPSMYVNGKPIKLGRPLMAKLVKAVELEMKRLKIKSPMSEAKLKKLGVDLSVKPKPRAAKPKPRAAVRKAPPKGRAASGMCKPGSGTQCAPPKKR